MFDAVLVLLAHTQSVLSSASNGSSNNEALIKKRKALLSPVANKKWRRIEFFNSENDVSLRLNVPGRATKQIEYKYYALFGKHKNNPVAPN